MAECLHSRPAALVSPRPGVPRECGADCSSVQQRRGTPRLRRGPERARHVGSDHEAWWRKADSSRLQSARSADVRTLPELEPASTLKPNSFRRCVIPRHRSPHCGPLGADQHWLLDAQWQTRAVATGGPTRERALPLALERDVVILLDRGAPSPRVNILGPALRDRKSVV